MSFFKKKWFVLCDEFSWHGWKHEGAQRVMGPDISSLAWEALICDPPRAKFFLIESAWQNFYQEGHSIKHQFPRLIKALKGRKIPVVFWNKEDPMHYERFSPFAMQCDLIYTSDIDCIPRYMASGYAGKIKCLPFPVQPKIHRPYFRKELAKKVFFAGRYTDQHEGRRRRYETFLKPAIQTGLVDIFARTTKFVDASSWPAEMQSSIVGSLEYEDLIKEYTKYSIGLSISSVSDSLTMFPRRVVEMTMGNILVISDQNEAISRLFPEIPQAADGNSVVQLIHYFLNHAKERQEVIKKTQRRILKNHTYRRAVQDICRELKKEPLLALQP